MNKPLRPDIPVWIAAIGPKNVELAAEVAQGWQPIHFVPDRFQQVWGDALKAGAAKRDAELGPLQIMAGGTVALGIGPGGTRGSRGHPGQRRLLRRRHGRPREELLQRAVPALRLGRRGRARSRTCSCRAIARRPSPRCPTSTSTWPPSPAIPGYVRERIGVYKEVGVTYLNINVVGEDPLKIFEQVKAWAE